MYDKEDYTAALRAFRDSSSGDQGYIGTLTVNDIVGFPPWEVFEAFFKGRLDQEEHCSDEFDV